MSERLPRLAWLALAARTTERCLPIIDFGWPDMPSDARDVVFAYPGLIMEYAAGRKRPKRIGKTLDPLCRFDLLDIKTDSHRLLALQAIGCVRDLDGRQSQVRPLTWDVSGLFTLYYIQFPWITGKPHDAMIRLHLLTISRDFDIALQTASGTGNATPFDSSVFGELWPFGKPAWLTEPWPILTQPGEQPNP